MCIICMYYICLYFIYLDLFTNAWPIQDSEGIGALLGADRKNRTFCLLTLPKQVPFLTISNKNIFFKTQGNRLVAIVAPNKRLE